MSDTYDRGYGVHDAELCKTKALSNGAGTVESDALDLGSLSYLGSRLAAMNGQVSGPALTTTQLPDDETVTYTVEHADEADFSDATDLVAGVLVQTGAGGAGAAAASARYAIPPDCKRYLRVKAVKTGSGDCTGVSLTHELLF